VTDAGGKSASKEIAIAVTDPVGNRAPSVLGAAAPASGKAPLEVVFTAEGSDPDGDALTYAWDFGDGSTAAGRRARHTYTGNGTFTAKVTATDPSGLEDADTVSIVVGDPAGNQAPTVQAAADPASGTGPLTVSFSADGRDPDGDQIAYEWDFGDGVKAGGPRATHTYATAGTYSAVVTVRDPGGRTAGATVTVTVTAALPAPKLADPGTTKAPATGLRAVTQPSPAGFGLAGVKVAVACETTGTGYVDLRASKVTAKRLGLTSRVLARRAVKCATGKTVTVTVKPAAKVRRALKARKPASVRFTVAAAFTGAKYVERTVTLR
jgi:PKD repeat protein